MFDTLLPLIFSGASNAEERVYCMLMFIFFIELLASLVSSVMGMTNNNRRGK